MNDILLNKVYRHFKGNYYIVQDIALDCETLEKHVVYRSLYDNKVWVRKLSNFISEVDPFGEGNITKQKCRFEYVDLSKEGKND